MDVTGQALSAGVAHPGTRDTASADLPMALQTAQHVKKAKKKQTKQARRADRSAQGPATVLQTSGQQAATSLGYGKFEQHTTGFGSKMLARWGFAGQGSGLGRNSQGIAEPLSAVRIPKQKGLGAL